MTETIDTRLGRFIRALRRLRGIPRQQIIDPKHLYLIERGIVRRPTLLILTRVANGLGINPYILFLLAGYPIHSLGFRIALLRSVTGLHQRDSGVSQGELSRIETDAVKNPGINTIVSIANTLDVTVEELLQKRPEHTGVEGLEDTIFEIEPEILAIVCAVDANQRRMLAKLLLTWRK